MAYRLTSKIHCLALKRMLLRSMSAKAATAEVETIASKSTGEEAAGETSNSGLSSIFSAFNSNGQYEVCRPRTTPVTLIKHDVHNETEMAKKSIALQHLQPAMLPNYYQKVVEVAIPYPGAEPSNKAESAQMRKEFEDSKTKQSVTLPLKTPKLAKPFPDPVKVMYSHTVSDQEKAEQMLAETKQAKQYQQKRTAQGYTQSKRNYSTTVHYRKNPHQKTLEQAKFLKKVYKAARLRPLTVKMPLVKAVPIVYPSSYGKFDFTRAQKFRSKSPGSSAKKVLSPYPCYSETFKELLFNRKNLQYENGQYRTISNNAIEAVRKKKDCERPPIDERTLPTQKKQKTPQKKGSTSGKKKQGEQPKPKKKADDGSGGNEPFLMSEDLRYADREWQKIMSMLEGKNQDLPRSLHDHHHYQLLPTDQHSNTSGQM